MKVCTDACILGAYAAQLAAEDNQISRCLDIGAGTGLLSLMIAQRSAAIIDAIDIDINAFEEGNNNFNSSPWSKRLHYIHSDVISYHPNDTYDLIFTNPPFYEKELQSPHHFKNIARHDDGLTLQELAIAIDRNLSSAGKFILLLPFQRVDEFEEIATRLLFHLHTKISIRHSNHHPYSRVVMIFSRESTSPSIHELIIKDESNNYTPNFNSLLKDYYLLLD